MELRKPDYDLRQWKTIFASAALLIFWLLAPIYLQKRFDYSAVQVSLFIIGFYYVGFKLWKRLSSRY